MILEKTKQQIIIEAARDRFAHFGFSKVTMEEIASDVELGKASLYYYFPTKEDLFKEVIALEQKELVQNIHLLIEKSIPASQKLREYVKLRMKFFQDVINLGTLSLHSYTDSKSIYQEIFLAFEKVELSLLKKIIAEGKQLKEFGVKTKNETVIVFLHILQGLRCRILRRNNSRVLTKEIHNNLLKEMLVATEIFINSISCK
jgi:TetR/AcrR family transcriptional regulator